MGLAEKLWYINMPPTVDGPQQVLSDTTGAAAVSFDWYDQLVTAEVAPKGKCFLLVEAVTEDVYLRFGDSATTGTDATNGILVVAGSPGTKFYVNPIDHAYIDHIAPGGAGVLKVQVCSPIGERRIV